LADAVAVIEWLAVQPWCNGSVGMMGISWGGFNALQVAALQPEALKAVISIASTVDRFNDDIHYKGGALLSANLSWSSFMLCYSSRPPDPLLVGDGWRAQWLDRLEHEPLLLATWLGHQTRDDYWKHGSISETYDEIKIPVLIMAGWADGYKNAPPAALENLKVPVKAMIGPWIHKYPHFAWPKPRADFHSEAIRWWDRWLNGIDNGAERLPAYRAYITEDVRPGDERRHDPGRWVAEPVWPAPAIKPLTLALSADGSLSRRIAKAGVLSVRSPQDCGVMGGEFFSLSIAGDLPGDQRGDDAGSLIFETEPLIEPVDVLGRPAATLRIAIDQALGNIVLRLVDVRPDGSGHRVSYGVLNLAHRTDQAHPQPMQPGVPETITLRLDESGHRFRVGHRIRLAVSTAYWPLVLPPPRVVTATVETGGASAIVLPVRQGGDTIDVPEPANPDPLPKYRQLTPEVSRRWVERDLVTGLTRYQIVSDSGESEIAAAEGLIVRELREETYTIAPRDPLSAVSECRWLMTRRRGDWSVHSETATRLTADATTFHIAATLRAFEGANPVFARDWNETVPRNHM
jgi:putative CocE/NonD family hydrolase